MNLRNLPYEVIWLIVESLDLADIRNLSLSCHRLAFLTQDESITKAILELKAPYSPEAGEARTTYRYASNLRRLFKRHEALSSASPYLLAIVAVADSYIYSNGCLCYINERKLRILDLHRPDGVELAVDIRKLLDEAIDESKMSQRYRFQLLYMAHDIVSCLYTHSFDNEQTSWLVVFNAKRGRLLTTIRLDSSYKLFVRNNEAYLYFGTHSDVRDDGFRHWALKGFDIRGDKWLDKLPLTELAGSDLGCTICFELHDGYFYGISSQATFEIEEIDWSSCYICFRFPLDQPDEENLEWASKKVMWRRQHAEGPLDDRWTFLRLWKDQKSGQLSIVESRKEYLVGHSTSRRTYYTTNLVFPDETGEDISDSDDGEDYPRSDPLANIIDKDDRPNYMPPQRRNPHLVHPGEDGFSSLFYTFNQVYIRSYHPSCQTFLDLVDDRLDTDSLAHRIRLRVGTRHRRSFMEWQAQPLAPQRRVATHSAATQRQLEVMQETEQEIHRLYRHEPVKFWPPTAGAGCVSDTWVEALHEIMNPPGFRGSVTAAWDDRSLVYGVGNGNDDNQALIFISFDAGVHLRGIPSFRGGSPLEQQLPSPEGLATGMDQTYIDEEHLQRHDEGYESQGFTSDGDVVTPRQDTTETLPSGEGWEEPAGAPWCQKESPMYESICRGFHFAK